MNVTENTVNRGSLKWNKVLLDIAADPTSRTIYHKMGPLMIPLKPLNRNGTESLRLTMTIDKKTDSYLVPVTDILKQCGVE